MFRMPQKSFAIDAPQAASLAPEQFISIEEVARRLHTDVGWVREKIRRRCPNPNTRVQSRSPSTIDWQSSQRVGSQLAAPNPRPSMLPQEGRAVHFVLMYAASTFSITARICLMLARP